MFVEILGFFRWWSSRFPRLGVLAGKGFVRCCVSAGAVDSGTRTRRVWKPSEYQVDRRR